MSLAPGTHKLGPSDGSLELHTYRDGIAQAVGHDLVIDVSGWEATIQVDEAGLQSVSLQVDTGALAVREGRGGVKPLSDKDKADIKKSIDDKVLKRQPVSYESDGVDATGGLTMRGRLTIVGMTRPTSFELELGGDGRVRGMLSITQSEWGIKPYKAMMGALKVRDDVEIELSVQLPTS